MKKVFAIVLLGLGLVACNEEESIEINERDQTILLGEDQANGGGSTDHSGGCPTCQ